MQNNGLAADAGFTTFYIFENSLGTGFVIVSADDCVQPVLAYSATDIIMDNTIPATTKTFLAWYDRQIKYCVTKDVAPTTEITAMWQRYLSDEIRVDKSAGFVTPMLTTKWNQSPIYNNLCPYDTYKHTHVPAGCVAVAMAQALKYWNHPKIGVGRNSYNHSDYGTITAEFNNTTYEWTNMPNQLNANSTFQQSNAVATLMYHCGASCNMNYGTEGSSAAVNGPWFGTSEFAFKHFFGYKNTLHSIRRDDTIYTDSLWTETIRFELDNGRPVVYTGYDYTDTNDVVGHAFVCDGYDTNDFFHFNWGWGGSCDGYYAMSDLHPSYVFNDGQRAIIGMEPDSNLMHVTPTSHTIPGLGGTASSMVFSAPHDSATWTASTEQTWISLSRTTGPGLGDSTAIVVTAAPNNTGHSRNGFVNIVQDSQSAVIYIFQPDVNHSESGWYGNSVIETEVPVLATEKNMILIRPESYGNFAPGDKVTHIKFKTHKVLPQYNNGSFSIKIYRNSNFTSNLSSGQCDASSSRGRVVYSEDYTITNFDIEQIVALSVPYVITDAPFWIGLQSSGGTKYYARQCCRGANDSLQIHYLDNYASGNLCPALSTSNPSCEIEYYFQFLVELGRDGIEQPGTKTVPDVKVFPNPTTGTVNFSQEVRHVEVYDNMGRRVLSDDNTYTLDLSAMRKGLYTLRLTTEQGTVLRKVIKQR